MHVRRYVTVLNCLDLKIKKNDVYQRDPVRCMLQISIFPASATKIQKYLLWTWAKKIFTDRSTHLIFQRSGYGKQTIS